MAKLNVLRHVPKKAAFRVLPALKRYRLAACVILGALTLTTENLWAQGGKFELLGGLGAVEEGDDRLRPAAVVQAGKDHFYGQGTLYGRRFAQVEERTFMLGGGYRTEIFQTKWLQAAVGAVVMEERTTIHPRGTQTKIDSQSSYNVGGTLGIRGVWNFDRYLVQASWDSALFPAGAAVLFLTTGRKQTVSLSAGARF